LANRDDRRGDIGDRTNDRRDDWRQGWDDRREDWSDRWHDQNWHYDDWHHGHWHDCWHDDYHGWWGGFWNNYPAAAAFGLTMWGLNQAAYGFGLWGYTNPYYVEPVVQTVPVDYSEPLVVYETPTTAADAPPETAAASAAPSPGASESLPPGVDQAAMTYFDQAREEFYHRQYEQALASTDKALQTMPKDAVINEFRALVLFALGKYQEAAAVIYSVLSVGPGWDWTTMATMYPSVDVYTDQLRKLEAAATKSPDTSYLRFLLAYHYTTMGHKDAAVGELKKVVELTPNDRLSKELLTMMAGPDALPNPPVQPPPAPSSVAPAIPADSLVGNWKASANGSQFGMNLADDGRFTWSFSRNGKEQKVAGVFAVDGNTLAMEPDSGGTMLADLKLASNNSLSFRMVGSQPNDPALVFRK
jgi:hypothetical protein